VCGSDVSTNQESTATMLITLKSDASGDVVMLEASGRQMVGLLGKDSSETTGIITVVQLPGAINALKHAVEADRDTATGGNSDHGSRLFQRAPPILELLERSLTDETPVTWGV
jgi:hypothetical protein